MLALNRTKFAPFFFFLLFFLTGETLAQSSSTLTNDCLSVTYSTAPGEVNLSWSDVNESAETYKIKRSNPGQGFGTIAANLAADQQSYTDTVDAGSCYQYFVEKKYREGSNSKGKGKSLKCRSEVIDPCSAPSNEAPVANAGEDISVEVGSTVFLDGVLSADPDGDPLSYQWELLSAPAGSTSSLSDPSIVNPTLELDKTGTYELSLVVDDGELSSEPDTITISTLNRAPVADAGPDQNVFVGDTASLDASSSFDLDGDALSYSWTLTDSPVGSTASLQNPTGVSPTLIIDRQGEYTLSLVVSDGELSSAEDLIVVSTSNRTPTASAGDDQEILLGETTSFDGGASSDPDGDSLSYSWLISEAPEGSVAEITGADSAAPQLTPDLSGVYRLDLVVSDGQENSASDSVLLVVIKPNEAPEGVVATYALPEDANIAFTLQGIDPDEDELTFMVVAQPASGSLTGTLPNLVYIPNENFNGTDSLQFTVSDGEFSSEPASIFFDVQAVNDAPVAEDTTVSATEDSPLEFSLEVTDPDEDELSYVIVNGPTSGVISGTAPDLTYTPDPNFSGTDTISFTVSDGTETVGPVTITLSVSEVNDAPVADEQSLLVNAGESLEIILTGTDIEGSELIFQIEDAPTGGTLSGVAPELVYTPTDGFSGEDSLTFLVNDGDLDSTEVVVTIEVVDVNEPPEIVTSGPRNAFQNELYEYAAFATDPNPGDTLSYSLEQSPAGVSLNSSTGELSWYPQNYLVNPVVGFNPNCQAPSEFSDTLYSGDDFSMTVEWAWTGSPFVPISNQVRTSPVVGNLTDDNGDGIINEQDVPDIVFVTQPPLGTPGVNNDCHTGTLRAIHGDGSGEIFTVRTDLDGSLLIQSCVNPVIVDLDYDGIPEIVTLKNGPIPHYDEVSILVFNADGSLKSRGEDLREQRTQENGFLDFESVGAIEVADLENDGEVEIIYANAVFDSQGNVKFNAPDWGDIAFSYSVPSVADVDMDGVKEVIFGSNIYDSFGGLFLEIPLHPRIPLRRFSEQYPAGYLQVVNLDGDISPEFVITNTGKLTPVNHDGSLIVDAFNPTRFNQPSVAPSLIADIDSDGESEVIVAATGSLAAFEQDFSTKWFNSINEGFTGLLNAPVAVDLNGDGRLEILAKSDEGILVFEGETGRILDRGALLSNAAWGSPIPVDVDRDGKIEIVTHTNSDTSNGGTSNGIFVFGNSSWTSGPSSWSKYNYIAGQFNDQLQLVDEDFFPWLSHNSVRTVQPSESGQASLIDLALIDLIVEPSEDGTVSARVKPINLGTRDLDTRAIVRLHRGSPAFPGEILEEKEIFALPVGESTELVFNPFALSDLDESVFVTIEPDGRIPECISTNNFAVASLIELEASDNRGLSDSQLYSVQVFPEDFTPNIISVPPGVSTSSQDFIYQVRAEDPTIGDFVSYSLEGGPQGIEIDPVSGIISWSPLFGTENFSAIVKATDLAGNSDEQVINVDLIDSCNSPTVINTDAPEGAEGVPYAYQLNYYYPGDPSELEFFIETAPEGMVIDSATGLITWEAPVAGTHVFTIVVQDEVGLRDVKSVEVIIRDATGEEPNIGNTTLSVQAGRLLNGRRFPFGDTISAGWSIELISGPDGFEIDQGGRYTWLPDSAGTFETVIDYTSPELLTRRVNYTINVSEAEEGAIDGPTLINSPPTTIYVGESLDFGFEVEPNPLASNPSTSVSLAYGPEDSRISFSRMTWTPTAEDLGVHEYGIFIRHSFVSSRWTFHRLAIEVVPRPCGVAEYPRVVGSPITVATVGEPYGPNILEGIPGAEDFGYEMSVDVGPNMVQPYFELIEGPSTAELSSTQGILRWNPVTGPAGPVDFVVEVALGFGGPTVEHRFQVIVSDPLGSEAPEITSEPPFFVTVEELFQYQVEATDPSGGELRYFLARNPSGMEIDMMSGLISWTPSSEQFGRAEVELIVESSNGARASQAFPLSVRAPGLNSAPFFDSTPSLLAKVGVEYIYDSNAVEEDADDEVSYVLEGAPLGMSVGSTNGIVSWTPTQTGIFSFILRAEDARGGVDTQTINLEVIESADLQLTVDKPLAAPGETVAAGLSITQGDVEGSTLELFFNGEPLTPVPGFVSFEVPSELGDYQLLAVYTDQIETVTESLTVTVSNELPGTPPEVEIISPVGASEVTAPENILISVSDPTLVDWTLSVIELGSLARSQQPIVLATGNTELSASQVAEFDPTLLTNGLYELRLEAVNSSGQVGIATQALRVDGEMKVGNFTISFIDLSIPVSGIPITITRTYDSRLRNQELDFGYGWAVTYQAMKVSENKIAGENWLPTSVGGAFPTFCVEPGEETYVAVTLPDGDVEEFDVRFSPECQPLVPIEFVTPVFVPRAGTSSTLEWTESYPLSVSNGEIFDPVVGDTFDPNNYILTTKDGTQFEVEQGVGIRELSDPNENTLTFTDNGIFHSDGKSILFTRDADGNITEVIAPDGTKILYGYDAAGDLVSVTDQTGDITSFTYGGAGVGAPPAHYLSEIIDPRGEVPARMFYDEDGRLVRSVDADGNEILYDHDIEGRQEFVTDRRGFNTVFVYDDEGNVLTRTDALGGTMSYSYDVEGNELTVTDENGNTTTNTYDANNNILSETDPIGRQTSYSYDEDSNLLSITDDAGNVTDLVYDDNRNLTTLTDAEGNVTANEFDAKGNLTQVTDAEGNVTTYSYDGNGYRVQMVDNIGTVTDYTYDDNGNQLTRSTSRTTAAGVVNYSMSMVYDDENRVIQETNYENEVTSTVYNSIDKVESTTDGRGNTTSMTYDARGNLDTTTFADGTTESVSYDAENNRVSSTDRLNRVTSMVYDELNRMTSMTYPDGAISQSVYDPGGRLTRSIDARGNATDTTYDDAGQVLSTTNALGDVASFTYDNRGNRLSATNERGHETTFAYDDINRNTLTTYPDSTTMSRVYDGLSRMVSMTDQNGNSTSYGYDGNSRLVSVTDALSQVTSYSYDEQNNKLTQTDAEGRVTSWSYDNLGRVLTRTLPLGQIETMGYDLAGNMSERVDFKGNETTYTYDELNRMLTRIFDNGQGYTYSYTATGRVATDENALGVTTYTYDARDRLIREDKPNGQFLAYSYDLNGNRLSVETGLGTTSYSFDVLNRQATVTDSGGAITSYVYDEVGNATEVQHANGTITSTVFDNLERPVSVATTDIAGNVLTQFDYTLDDAGNRTQIAETGRTVDYQYDDIYRLTRETVTDALNGNSQTDFSYDMVGNRLTKVVLGGATENFQYDGNDRLVSDGAKTFDYDQNGNLVTINENGQFIVLGYDLDDLLVDYRNPFDLFQWESYSYDVGGIRQGKSEPFAQTAIEYLVDENRPYAQVLEERDGGDGSLLASYLYGMDLLSQDRAGVRSHYHYDALGSTRALSDSSGTLTDNYDYTPYGEVLNQTGTTENNYLFTGEQFDPATNQYYLRARYMNPSTGRFTQMDEWMGRMRQPITLNKYAYANSNPAMFVDPSGRASVLSNVAAIGVFSVLTVATIQQFNDDGVVGGMSFNNAVNSIGIIERMRSVTIELTLLETPFGPIPIFEARSTKAKKKISGELNTAVEHAEKIANGPPGGRDENGWKGEVRAALRRAKRLAEKNLKGVNREKVLAKIENIARKSGVSLD